MTRFLLALVGLLATRWTSPRVTASLLPLALIGMVLCSPALGTGPRFDDYVHDLVFRGFPGLEVMRLPQSPLWTLFTFLDGDMARTRAVVETGVLPWWVDPDLRVNFMRPLTAATHWLDFVAWRSHPWLAHFHSLLWYGLWCVLTAGFYRRLFQVHLSQTWRGSGASETGGGAAAQDPLGKNGGAAGKGAPLPLTPALLAALLAALAFAFDDSHGVAAAWLANRNGLIIGVFAVATLWLHDRAAREGDRVDGAAGVLAFALGLLSGEAMVGVTGYLVAHTLFLDDRPWGRRLAHATPYFAVFAAWGVLHHSMGYGSSGSGLYVDPLQEPLRFVWTVGERLPYMLGGALTPLASEIGFFMPLPWAIPYWILVTLLLAGLGWAGARLVGTEAAARFLACGMVLSTLPVCATFPSDRVLVLTSMGAMGLVGLFLARFLVVGGHTPVAENPPGTTGIATTISASSPTMASSMMGTGEARGIGLAVAFLVFSHFVFAPLNKPFRSLSMAVFTGFVDRCAANLPPDPDLAEQTWYIVHGIDGCVGYTPLVRAYHDLPTPRMRILSTGAVGLLIERIDATTLRLTPEGGWYSHAPERLIGGSAWTTVGEKVPMSDLEIEVERVSGEGRPLSALVRFRTDPETNPRARILRYEGTRPVPYRLPPVGEKQWLPPVNVSSLIWEK